MIPNIIYALKNRDEKNLCTNKFMNLIEQIGRYACIFLLSGLLLRHCLLVGFSLLFAIGHIYVTKKNIENA